MHWHRLLPHGVRGVAWIAGVVVVALAVMMLLAQLLLPLAARQPQWVAAQLSERLQRPVSIGRLEGHWHPSGPGFVLHDVDIGAAPGATGSLLRIPQLELRLDLGAWLLPSRHLLNVRVRDLRIDASRERDGQWRINGVNVAGADHAQALPLGRLSADLWLRDVHVRLTDVRSDKRYALTATQLRVSRRANGRVRLAGVVRRDGAGAALRVVADVQPGGEAGRAWIGVDAPALQNVLADVVVTGRQLKSGRGRIAAWVDWRDGKPSRAVLRLDLDRLRIGDATGATLALGDVHGLAGWRVQPTGYQLRVAADDGGGMLVAGDHTGTPQSQVRLLARHWQLAPWLPLLALHSGTPPALAAWLGQGHPRALVSTADVRWHAAGGLQALQMAFTDAGIAPVGKLPGVGNLHGELRGDAQSLALWLPDQATTLRLPTLFRAPLDWAHFGGTLAAWRQDGDWLLGVDALDVAGADYAAQVRGQLRFPAAGGAPVADIHALVPHAQVTAAKAFWPLGSMSPATVTWLDRALVAGQIENAQVVLRGDLADWPFREHTGRFEAHVPIRDLTLDYAPDWPAAEHVNVQADFIGNGLHAQASGRALGVRAEQVVADIADFDGAPLQLAVRGSGSGGQVMNFVRRSPIGRDQAEALGNLTVGGTATFDFQLQLPLHDDGEPQLAGTAQLQGADVRAPAWNLDLRQLGGPLQFDVHGVRADALRATFRGREATLGLALGRVAGHEDTRVWAQMHGRWSLAQLLADYPSLAWIGDAGTGNSDFTIAYALAAGGNSSASMQQLSVSSSLRGLALDLPAPLHKGADAALRLQVNLGLPIAGSDLQIALGDAARLRLRLADDRRPLAGVLAFGAHMPQDLPAQGLLISGHARTLDVTGWVARTAGDGMSEDDSPLIRGIRVNADQTQWFGRPLGAMHLSATLNGDVLEAVADGPAMAGTIAVPGKALDRQGVTARLDRLYWPRTPAAAEPMTAAPAAASTSAAVAAPVAPAPDPADTGINPAALPPLHLWVADLRMGDARLGEARLETWPTAQGMHIEQLRALSRDVQITASGDWTGTAHASHSRMRVNFAAEDLGSMLGAFGFEGLVQGGRTHDVLQARWPGAPSAFSLANMDGTLSIKVEDGRIPEAASPGVGRLLGLVSLAELPRRLTLDFGDVFGKGLAFDAITGDFRLADGNATTDNLVIAGPSAHIAITGRTGLRARDYDQQLEVVPRVGNSLPLVGAVVGGPVGAAAGLAVQGLLGKGLNQAASARYRITGPWSKPVMTLIEKKAGVAPVPASPPVPPAVPASAASTGD